MHEHPDAVAVILTDGVYRMTLAGGQMEDPETLTAGAPLWTPATTLAGKRGETAWS